jgi:hypothetical protein
MILEILDNEKEIITREEKQLYSPSKMSVGGRKGSALQQL